ncbi:hypothetical protein RJT34_33210 [Clitoria ternatea]|uniref:Uncharacterized protein n=1 Tax=Clitoria ternatea TaxID=43366 RepID=A0AAN9EZY6_CLITE
MFGRIRVSPSSLDTLEGSPNKIIKHDSLSIYEATLMKLKLGAQRGTSVCSSSKETDEAVANDCSVSSPCAEETNFKSDVNPASASCSEITMMDTNSESPSFNHRGDSEQRRQANVSILRFFKVKDSGVSTGATTSTRNGSSESVTSTCIESHCSEVEDIQTSQDCQMSDL